MIVLIVEDDGSAGSPLEIKLQKRGCKVHWSVDWRGAATKIPLVKPDVIVVDLLLPDVTPSEVLFLATYSGARVVVVSALRGTEMDLLKAEFPSVKFLEKPVALDDIVAAIEQK